MVASTVEMFEALGFLRKSRRSAQSMGSQLPWRSSRLKTKLLALTRSCASALDPGSGYELAGTWLLGEAKPPAAAQIWPPSGPARYLISASACGVELSIMATSPAPWIAFWLALSAAGAGEVKKS